MKLLQILKTNYYLNEGGNVDIGGKSAERINLTKISRPDAVNIINQLLTSINSLYTKTNKVPLWSPKLIQSKNFLSGSSFHFFDPKIPDQQFVKHKPMVGDIDTQVDKTKKQEITNFLQSIQGKEIGPATFIGFKLSPGSDQLITLWEFIDPPMKLQIDLELVDYQNNEPTEWSRFSHSSSWNDIESNIKGVFHKYLLRAFTTKTLRDRLIQMKRGKLKKIASTDLAFSVANGMREKYQPVVDTNGEQKIVDGLPVYIEIPTSQSSYTNNLSNIFELLFDRTPSEQEKKQLWSFKGGLQLANKFLNDEEKKKLINGFIMTLFGNTAQQLYKNDSKTDKEEKMIALNTMIEQLGMQGYFKTIQGTLNQTMINFYSKYKMNEDTEPIVKASPRKSVQHLQKMNDVEFIDLIKKIKNEMKGYLNNVKMTLKIDGLGARFGKDRTGRPFFESSQSGPIFTGQMFSQFAKSQGFTGEKLTRAKHYDDIYNLVMHSNFIKQLPNDTKVACEILYNPMAEITDNGLKFVTISYNRSVLGKLMSIVPLYVEVASTGEPHPQNDEIKSSLINIKEENGIKFIDNRLAYTGTINVNTIINPILSLNDRSMEVLASRKKVDLEEKMQVKALIQTVKDELANYIITHRDISGKNRLGPDIEGLILYRDNQEPIKITTPAFKQAIAAKKQPTQENIIRTGKGNTAIVGWGRGMGHKGHIFLASSVITHANQLNADPYFIVSKTVGKDDPLTPDEKLAIYKKVFPKSGHIFQPATEEMSGIIQVLTKLSESGYKNVVIIVGADQKNALGFVKNYNGKPDKQGNILYKFDKLDVISRQETNDPSKGLKGPRATPMRDILMDPKASDKQKFQVWRDAMNPEISDKEVINLMKTAQSRMKSMIKSPKKSKIAESDTFRHHRKIKNNICVNNCIKLNESLEMKMTRLIKILEKK